jgi:nucleotide-binding universal stress UspA family protein
MKHILVATDFSNDAYCALFYVAKLMASRPCTIYILNVFDENTPLHGKKTKLFGSKKRLKELEKESKENLTSTYHKIIMDAENARHRFQIISKKGILVKVITKILDEHQIDLVVMGTKGQTGAKEIFLGSNTVQAANAITKCPILAVPKQIDYKAPKEIAFMTDLKKGCVKEAIAPLLYLASLTEASIRVMHINEEEILNKEQESHRKQLELCLKDVNHSFHWVQEFDDKAMVIDAFIEKMKVDMFAMIHHKRSFFEMLVREPVIKDISIYSDIPFLILPQQE